MKYDYIMFHGSQRVGKIIMKRHHSMDAADVGLGGKSPCIVERPRSAHGAKTHRMGKFINAGRPAWHPTMCMWMHVKQALINYLIEAITELYGKNRWRSRLRYDHQRIHYKLSLA